MTSLVQTPHTLAATPAGRPNPAPASTHRPGHQTRTRVAQLGALVVAVVLALALGLGMVSHWDLPTPDPSPGPAPQGSTTNPIGTTSRIPDTRGT